ncbi:putative ATP-dependent RNA helicase DDX4 [Tachypleus tridentatus]|uniref:putative ATP-dependent RNA helicase DDX4 n=1 Tax=Tachypleus tridentatus TaxID=6853 RepID=UPI003FD2D933
MYSHRKSLWLTFVLVKQKSMEAVAFSQVRYLILEEADRMLDMGFVPAVIKMVDDPSMTVKSKHQTLMFSTTFPEEIQRLAAEFLKSDYLFLAVGVVGSANMDVKQNFYQVQQYEKRQKLIEILNNSGITKGLLLLKLL